MTIEHAGKRDIPAMTALWQTTFGDSEALIERFFSLLEGMGEGVIASEDGVLLGMAFALRGFTLLRGEREIPLGYIYAVAVDGAVRGAGIGGELTKAAAALCRLHGCEIITTYPASEGLYAWYEKLIDTRYALHRTVKELPARGETELRPLSAAEYCSRREQLLRGSTHVRLNAATGEYEAELCRSYGGGLYAVTGGLAAAYKDGFTLEVKELLCAADMRETVAMALGKALGCATVRLSTPSEHGERTLVADEPFPRGCYWPLALD